MCVGSLSLGWPGQADLGTKCSSSVARMARSRPHTWNSSIPTKVGAAVNEALQAFLGDAPKLGKDAKGRTCLLPLPFCLCPSRALQGSEAQ